MAITGLGTEDNPFVVHSYEEFISLSQHEPISGTSAVYIKFFDRPNQVIDCNDYGSEFKWGHFTTASNGGTYTIYIDLNGCTIKNFIIADGVSMFAGHYYGISGAVQKIIISNGFIRNVFIGSSTSCVCGDYVEFHDVSMSFNFTGITVTPFSGDGLVFDNCAMYIVIATLATRLFYYATITDTDFEFHINNLNSVLIFERCIITDCRIQGKLAGAIKDVSNHSYAMLCYNYGSGNPDSVMTNCVVDMDASETIAYWSGSELSFYLVGSNQTLNTNVFCNSHGLPDGYHFPSAWNYMSHENIRNGAYLNSKGFTVVEVLGS